MKIYVWSSTRFYFPRIVVVSQLYFLFFSLENVASGNHKYKLPPIFCIENQPHINTGFFVLFLKKGENFFYKIMVLKNVTVQFSQFAVFFSVVSHEKCKNCVFIKWFSIVNNFLRWKKKKTLDLKCLYISHVKLFIAFNKLMHFV